MTAAIVTAMVITSLVPSAIFLLFVIRLQDLQQQVFDLRMQLTKMELNSQYSVEPGTYRPITDPYTKETTYQKVEDLEPLVRQWMTKDAINS